MHACETVQGAYSKAETVFREALQMADEQGDDKIEAATTLNGFALALHGQVGVGT